MTHRVAKAAETDLDQIWLHIARNSSNIDIANRVVDSITDRFSFLANFPYAGRARDADFGIRCRSFPVGDYVIVYQVDDDEIVVLRVFHGKRDLESELGSERSPT